MNPPPCAHSKFRAQPWGDEILTKWSDKVKAASGLPVNNKFKAFNQSMIQQLREGIVARRPPVVLAGAVECDEVYVVAGHKGHPEAVKKN